MPTHSDRPGGGPSSGPDVALIDPLSHHGGQHYYTDQLARGLSQAGVRVTVYGLAGQSLSAQQDVYTYVPAFRGIYGSDPALLRGLRFARGLLRILAGTLRRRHSIVHVNVWQYGVRELLQVMLAQLLSRDLVLTIHDVETFGATTNEFRRRWIMRAAKGMVIHNEYSLSRVPPQMLHERVTAVIPHVCHVDYLTALPTRAEARQTLDLPQDRTILLFFGNPRHEKGLDVALEAMARLPERGDLLLLTGGRMPAADQERFGQFVASHGLIDRVRMDTATVPDELAFTYYAASDVVLVPYREVYESGVAIMAASCGRAIIGSDLPVLVDFVDDGHHGALFRSEDPDDLARVIDAATRSSAALDAQGARARETIERERNSTLIGKMTADLYDRVLASSES